MLPASKVMMAFLKTLGSAPYLPTDPDTGDAPMPGEEKWNADRYANEVMTLLRDAQAPYGTREIYTSIATIMSRLEIPATSRDTLSKHLQRLVDLGRLRKDGKAKYYLAATAWASNNPFTRYDDAEELTDDSHHEPPVSSDATVSEGDTTPLFLHNKLKGRVETLEGTVVRQRKLIDELQQGLVEQAAAAVVTAKMLADEIAAAKRTQVLKIEKYDGTVLVVKDTLPANFDHVLSLVRCRRNVLLYGPAGCGKSHLAEIVSRVAAFPRFASISFNAGVSDIHLLGRAVPDLTKGKNRFQGTEFLDCYENGGLFLADELDAADPNILLCLNTALANGYISVPNRPDKPRAAKHDDFLILATANTVGRGATRQYVGRSQLDEATLDRFRIGMVECAYDAAVEELLCPDKPLRTTMQEIRRVLEAAQSRRVVSTRFLRDAKVMIDQGGWSRKKVYDVLVQSWTEDERAKVSHLAKALETADQLSA